MIRTILVLLCWLSAVGAASAGAFLPVEILPDGNVEPAAIDALVRQLSEARPDHVVVLVHGFNTTSRSATEIYTKLAATIRSEFQRLGRQVAVVGVHWASEAGGRTRWVKKSVARALLKSGEDPYLEKVRLARTVGQQGFRRVLLAIQEKSRARLHVFAHSLGCRVTGEAIYCGSTARSPEANYCCLPDRELELDVVCLAGADVEADQTGAGKPNGGSAQLFWITTGVVNTRKDLALVLRKSVRGGRAMGNALPLFRPEHLDELVKRCGLVLDNRSIPADHQFVSYYTPDRIRQLVEAAVTVADPEARRSEVLLSLVGVLTAESSVATLRRFLESRDVSIVYYALWRLDRLLCGSSQHLADGTLRAAFALSRSDPERLERERSSSPCKLVKRGIWPAANP